MLLSLNNDKNKFYLFINVSTYLFRWLVTIDSLELTNVDLGPCPYHILTTMDGSETI